MALRQRRADFGAPKGQYHLIPELSGDGRLLVPGWAGELNHLELEFVMEQLCRNKRLARLWGFTQSADYPAEETIRNLALGGDPEHRSANIQLTSQNVSDGKLRPAN